MSVDELLAGFPDGVAALAREVRTFVAELVPEASERVYLGWRGIGFHHPEVGYVFGIFPRRESVRLLFERGASLPDPEGALLGEGTQTRYLELRPGAPLPEETIARLVGRALSS